MGPVRDTLFCKHIFCPPFVLWHPAVLLKYCVCNCAVFRSNIRVQSRVECSDSTQQRLYLFLSSVLYRQKRPYSDIYTINHYSRSTFQAYHKENACQHCSKALKAYTPYSEYFISSQWSCSLWIFTWSQLAWCIKGTGDGPRRADALLDRSTRTKEANNSCCHITWIIHRPINF